MEKKNNKELLSSKKILRATIEKGPEGSNTFRAVMTPQENGQLRYSYENDEYFMQVLRTDEASVDSSRLELGLPLFDNHPYNKDASNTLGITRAYEFTERGIEVVVEWGARADAELRADVDNGVLRTLSVEGDVYEYEVTRNPGELPKYNASKWLPDSVSIAPVPNDAGAQIEVKRELASQIERQKAVEKKDPESESYLDKIANNF